MWLRYANGVLLISAKTAEEIVRMIVRDEFGETALVQNEPLSVRDDRETWLVCGSPLKRDPSPPQPTWAGPVQVRISKLDGQIVDYVYTILPG